jgi:predicted DNA-binding transcriptional regulator AlpA
MSGGAEPLDLDRFVTIAEAAGRLAIGRSTAFRLAGEGRFPVPVQIVAGKQVVSLRLLVEFINSTTSEAVAS